MKTGSRQQGSSKATPSASLSARSRSCTPQERLSSSAACTKEVQVGRGRASGRGTALASTRLGRSGAGQRGAALPAPMFGRWWLGLGGAPWRPAVAPSMPGPDQGCLGQAPARRRPHPLQDLPPLALPPVATAVRTGVDPMDAADPRRITAPTPRPADHERAGGGRGRGAGGGAAGGRRRRGARGAQAAARRAHQEAGEGRCQAGSAAADTRCCLAREGWLPRACSDVRCRSAAGRRPGLHLCVVCPSQSSPLPPPPCAGAPR